MPRDAGPAWTGVTMKTYRIVFCDIDGTLLDRTHRVRPATAERVRRLVASGTPFVLVSARMPGAIHPIQETLGVAGPIVCYGGALILDGVGGVVHSLGLPHALAGEIRHRIVAEWPLAVTTVYSNDNWYVDDPDEPRVVTETKVTGVGPAVGGMKAYLAGGDVAHKLFCIGTPDEITAIEGALRGAYPELCVVRSSPVFLEITDGAVTKGNAVRFLCQAMRLPVDEAVAFGDNYNDIDMLQTVGLGVAMGNAPEAVKAAAGMITGTNDEEGVMAALDAISFAGLGHSVRFERARFGQA